MVAVVEDETQAALNNQEENVISTASDVLTVAPAASSSDINYPTISYKKLANHLSLNSNSGLRIHFQLRFGLSTMRYHKKRHNFIDTPSDKCCCNHGPEDINHFFFSCPLYTTCRKRLITNVMIILQKYNLNHLENLSSVYLYGHRLIKFVDNRSILLSTIKYLKESRRFST